MDNGAVELRDIEIFLTLAEELHFGRTAERLHLSQARVSQSIKKQERRLGAALFDRSSRVVTLTPLGVRLRDDLQKGYDQIHEGLARAVAAGQGVNGTLRLGVMGALGHELRLLTDQFAGHYPGCHIVMQEFHFSDPFTPLRAGEADLHLMWAPVREPDLTAGPVALTEGRVLGVASTHPLAARESVSLEDLGDHVTIDLDPRVPDYWRDAMSPARTPRGRPVPRGPSAQTFHEILTLVAAGGAVCPLNAHVNRYYTHPGVTYLPIADAPPTEWILVWSTAAEGPRIRAFAQTARDLGPRAIP
jgi:DNA-binding transcriptional LysR family regulator